MVTADMFVFIFCIFCFFLFPFPSGAAEINDIRDIRPPMELPFGFSFFLFVLLAVLAVAAFFLVKVIKNRKRKEIATPAASLKPWEIAYNKLNQLKQENLPVSGKIKEYYSRLGDIVRQYIEARFTIRAPEMTTPEFLSSVKSLDIFTGKQKNSLKEFLQICDMVKFAKYLSSVEETQQSYLLAQRFIDETKIIETVEGDKK